ncbi:RidA family protein [Clostridium cellulovorans]|uniref:Endoribonuclease L-PSP n=1 Tax=Clostridium cellulovorans (strain ATCC 35296 / DSM 3052 / OCM 3 / 743B) TaxID=573061 RepID=D9SRZ4_CLOC7|nr:RidA family protein [Clostridium cellulovorans]ADL52441.1 endoribonuclease L-PSP [Clostridium cellulovorans 743B]
MEKEIISTSNAPGAIGPYSQAVKVGNILYTSGQLPIVPATGELIKYDIKRATTQCLENVKGILDEVGTSFDKVIKTMIFLRDMEDFDAVNEVYAKYFAVKQPARSCVQVSKLPKNAPIEIEVIALVE